MKHMTVRNISEELHEALDREKNRRGTSLNQTVIDLLNQRLGIGTARSNGLRKLAGRWSEEEFRRFEAAIEPFERVDPELWQ